MTTADAQQEVAAPQVGSPKQAPEEDVIVPGPELKIEVNEKKLKVVQKEGGKRGVESEGAADMGGLQFFCTAMEKPEGSKELLIESMKAMNAKSDPSEEERKGGAGKIGKMLLSCTDDCLTAVTYVPKDKMDKCSAKEWLEYVVSLVYPGMGCVVETCEGVCDKNWAVVVMKKDGDKGYFPIKMRDTCITLAYEYLKKRDLFPDGDDDEDEMVFGDDDFPSM